jgi:hypothetical protein
MVLTMSPKLSRRFTGCPYPLPEQRQEERRSQRLTSNGYIKFIDLVIEYPCASKFKVKVALIAPKARTFGSKRLIVACMRCNTIVPCVFIN